MSTSLQPTFDATEMIVREPSKGPVCGCLQKLRLQLKADNGKPGVDSENGCAIVYVRRINADGPPPPIVLATWCPFCGERYQ